jgi:hypothetical protein
MSAQIVQQDSFSVNEPSLTKTMTFFEAAFGMKNIQAGNAIVVIWAGDDGNHLISLTDNYGNSYAQVPGAAINDGATSHASDIWWAQNVAGVTDPPTEFALNFTLDGSASNTWGAVVFEVSGINGATVVAVTKSVTDVNDSTFTGPALDGGSGAFYIAGTAGVFGATAAVASPWEILVTPGILGGGGTATEGNGGQACATLVSSGPQQATFTPEPSSPGWFIGAITAAAFIGGSGGSGGGGSSSLPFLGSVTEVDDAPSGGTDPFLGTVTVIDSAPSGRTNPYLGRIRIGTPSTGQTNPALGQVVVISEAPDGATDPYLGTVQQKT